MTHAGDTATKRFLFPSRYLRKDARTAIYTVLYGKSEATLIKGKRANDPSEDQSRRLPFFWEWTMANAVFKVNIEAAQFTPAKRTVLEAKLEALKAYRHKEQH